MYKILVTGGLGFIGSHIVEYFLDNGYSVGIIDNLSSNVVSKDYFDNVADIFIGDISDTAILEKVFIKEYDYIFHFAANASVPKSVEDDQLNFKSNIIGTYNIIKKAIDYKSSIILASSAAIYGEANGKCVREDYTAKPISPYGLSKLIDESLCFHYSRIYNIKVVVFRLFNVYGFRQRHYVMSDFLKKTVLNQNKKKIDMLGSGDEIRDFVNINDVIKAITLPLKYQNMWGEAYNIGSGFGIRIKHVLYMMMNELNLTYDISFCGKNWFGDISGIYADINKIKSYGFQPLIDLKKGLKEFIKSEQANGILSNLDTSIISQKVD